MEGKREGRQKQEKGRDSTKSEHVLITLTKKFMAILAIKK